MEAWLMQTIAGDIGRIQEIGKVMEDHAVKDDHSIVVTDGRARWFVEARFPALFALYSAGWRNGYVVNGIRPAQ
jgi:hypothetical protein